MISNEAKKEIDFWVSKYPEGRKSSAVMQALTIVQKENGGSLNPDLINEVADYLEMPVISVQEVATFYENYNHCLLYTSPSPRDGLLSRMPSSA